MKNVFLIIISVFVFLPTAHALESYNTPEYIRFSNFQTGDANALSVLGMEIGYGIGDSSRVGVLFGRSINNPRQSAEYFDYVSIYSYAGLGFTQEIRRFDKFSFENSLQFTAGSFGISNNPTAPKDDRYGQVDNSVFAGKIGMQLVRSFTKEISLGVGVHIKKYFDWDVEYVDEFSSSGLGSTFLLSYDVP